MARYAIDGVEYKHHERSDFRRIEGKWHFVNGDKVSAPPVRRTGEKSAATTRARAAPAKAQEVLRRLSPQTYNRTVSSARRLRP